MEAMKALSKIIQPDPRSCDFALTELKDAHKQLSKTRLRRGVPEDVRSYFATIRNLCLYGRFVYAFYALAHSLTYLVIELALRTRLEAKEQRGRKKLHSLLKKAIDLQLITDESFSRVRRIRSERARWRQMERELGHRIFSDAETGRYVDILKMELPKLRNYFAHPTYHPIDSPGTAFFAISFAAEFINRLFKDQARPHPCKTAGSPQKLVSRRDLR